jgi:hypothetical protein
MQLGDNNTPSPLDAALSTLDTALTDLITIVETSEFDQLEAAQKVAVWQHFETIRNRLPLVDHRLIADAAASELAKTYCCSIMTQFLVRVLQLSYGEAASRVRAAAAVGPRISMLGERLEQQLPQLARLQRDGAVTAEKVAIVERAMYKLSRPGLHPKSVETAEQLLTDHAPLLGPADLRRYASAVVDVADPDGPEPIDDQLQQDRRYVELRQRRDGMWHLQGKLTTTVGAQLNAILDPRSTPRSSSIEDENGNVTKIVDERPAGQRLHDALDEVCGRLLRSADRPSVGGTPASVIVTIGVDDLLAKAGLAAPADGSQLNSDQLLRIAAEAEIWPTIINRDGIPLALGRSQRLASRGQTMVLIARDAGCSFPGCTHPPSWCDRHHIVDWIIGGLTDLNNLTLLCRYHHTHFLQKGWTCRMNAEGLPEWIPPWWVDRDQRPQVNARIQRLHAQRQLPRRRQAANAA